MKVLLIIPAYNEEECILNTVNSIKNSKLDVDYIVINDGSTDKTEEILRKNNINHIELIHNLGIGGAVQTGYKYALENNYDIAVQFDADGQHDINYVPALCDQIENNDYDLVIGSRFVEKKENFKTTKSRRIGINIISYFIKIATHQKIYDTTSGFRACNKRVISEFASSYPTEYPEPVTTAIMLKKKYKVNEIHANMFKRKAGISSINTWKSIYYMMNVCLSIIVIGFRRYK